MGRLQIGTTSREAFNVQQALNMARRPGTPKIPEDGAYTEELADRIRAFQKHCGLQRNGQPDALTMKALALEASSEPMELQITIRGRTYLMTKRDYNNLVDRTIKALRYKGPAGEIAANTAAIRAFWNQMNRTNRQSPVVSFLIETTRGVTLPQESVVKRAEKAARDVESALNSRDLKAVYVAMRRAEPIVNGARKQLYAYRKEVVQGGQNWITALEFTRDASFLAVGIMAGPVAASYGAGALASGAIAGAGTAAVETLATEVGHGIAGSSQGVGAATTNVVLNTLVGGSIGAITGGQIGDKIITGVGNQVVRRISSQWVRRVGQRAATKFIIKIMKTALAGALEGAITDILNQAKRNPEKLTWEKFMQSIAINMVTAGVFAHLDDVLLQPRMEHLVSMLPKSFKREFARGLGRKARDEMEINELLTKALTSVGNSAITSTWNKGVERAMNRASGNEKPQVLQQRIVESAFDRMMAQRLATIASAQPRRGR